MTAKEEHHPSGKLGKPLAFFFLMQATHLCFNADDRSKLSIPDPFYHILDIGIIPIHISCMEHQIFLFCRMDQFLECLQLKTSRLIHMNMFAMPCRFQGVVRQMRFLCFNNDRINGSV